LVKGLATRKKPSKMLEWKKIKIGGRVKVILEKRKLVGGIGQGPGRRVFLRKKWVRRKVSLVGGKNPEKESDKERNHKRTM